MTMKRKLNVNDVPEEAGRGAVVPNAPAKPTFASLGLDARITQAVANEKFAVPTAIQQKAIPLAIAGKDVLARAKTGSGKTLAYLLPILHSILHRKTTIRRPKSTTSLILVPTKELATQVAAAVRAFSSCCAQDVCCENITRKEDAAVTRARLAENPDIVVATPARANQWINETVLKLDQLTHLVIDEADLVLSYGHEEDLTSIAQALPTGVQKLLMSATLRTDLDTLTSLFFPDARLKPEMLDLSAEESAQKATLAQYIVRTAEEEKFLLIYAIFKLQLIKGKVIVFVADIDRCYRVKLFLEQFGIRSCVLNSELPVNSRLHVVEEFNRGVYDIIIAADEAEVVDNESGKRKKRRIQSDEAQVEGDDQRKPLDDPEDMGDPNHPSIGSKDAENMERSEMLKPSPKETRKPRHAQDREYGVARGIDFRHVTCVLNFDLPQTSKSYTHRIGRTARAGQTGMALSLFVPRELYRKHKPTSIPQCQNDEEALEKIKERQATKGAELKEWGVDWTKLDGFRYRLADALRSVTRIAVREARTRELRSELIKSEKLKRHFEENPEDLRHLRHDTDSHAIRQQHHLRHVPDYLLPAGGKAAVSKDVGFVGVRKDPRQENRIRKARAVNKGRGKGRIAKGKGLDPLKSLNARGRGKS